MWSAETCIYKLDLVHNIDIKQHVSIIHLYFVETENYHRWWQKYIRQGHISLMNVENPHANKYVRNIYTILIMCIIFHSNPSTRWIRSRFSSSHNQSFFTPSNHQIQPPRGPLYPIHFSLWTGVQADKSSLHCKCIISIIIKWLILMAPTGTPCYLFKSLFFRSHKAYLIKKQNLTWSEKWNWIMQIYT